MTWSPFIALTLCFHEIRTHPSSKRNPMPSPIDFPSCRVQWRSWKPLTRSKWTNIMHATNGLPIIKNQKYPGKKRQSFCLLEIVNWRIGSTRWKDRIMGLPVNACSSHMVSSTDGSIDSWWSWYINSNQSQSYSSSDAFIGVLKAVSKPEWSWKESIKVNLFFFLQVTK